MASSGALCGGWNSVRFWGDSKCISGNMTQGTGSLRLAVSQTFYHGPCSQSSPSLIHFAGVLHRPIGHFHPVLLLKRRLVCSTLSTQGLIHQGHLPCSVEEGEILPERAVEWRLQDLNPFILRWVLWYLLRQECIFVFTQREGGSITISQDQVCSIFLHIFCEMTKGKQEVSRKFNYLPFRSSVCHSASASSFCSYTLNSRCVICGHWYYGDKVSTVCPWLALSLSERQNRTTKSDPMS